MFYPSPVNILGVVMNWVNYLRELNTEAVLFDDYDAAIVGIVHMNSSETDEGEAPRCVALYDYDRMVAITAKNMKDNNTYESMEDVIETAMEYVDFNIAGYWYGPNTPVIMSMENRYAIHKQSETVQEGIRAAEGEGGTSSPDGAPESP
jgi:hypothetical protein